MKQLFQKVFDIRNEEMTRALLMFGYVFLIISSLLMLKPVRNALFLEHFSARQLPYVFILVAIVAAVVTSVYSRYAVKMRLNKLVRRTLIFILVSLGIFWVLLKMDMQHGWFIYLFYVWVAIFGVITTSQFWVMANYIFDAREARRLFSFIGAGAISGGICGGYLANLATLIGTENLLLVCMVFIVLCQVIMEMAWRRRRPDQHTTRQYLKKQQKSAGNPFKLLGSSRHLTYLAGIVGISVIVANLVDYQFNAIVEDNILSKDDRTAFFGVWLSNLSVVSLCIQLFLTRRVLSRLGVIPSLFLLPLGIFTGAVAILVYPELWAAVLIKVADGSFKQSINKAGFELLFLPVPSAIKPQAKSTIDVFVDSTATGLGGLLLIIFTGVWGFSTGEISLVVIGLILLWGILIIGVRKEYINAFRLAIEKRTVDLEDFSVTPDDASIYASLLQALGGQNERQILYALKLLENVKNQHFVDHLKRLVHHESSEIREQALLILRQYTAVDAVEDVRPRLHDESPAVRTEAIGYLMDKTAPEREAAVLKAFLDDEDVRLSAAALLFVARESTGNPAVRDAFDLKKLIEDQLQVATTSAASATFIKCGVANAIGAADQEQLLPILQKLLADDDPDVVKTALINAGETRSPRFLPRIIELLADKRLRKFAREALANYGPDIIDRLMTAFTSPDTLPGVRVSLPRVIAMMGVQKSVEVLVSQLATDDLVLRFEVIRSLNRLRKNDPLLVFPNQHIEENIFEEIRHYMQTLSVLYVQQQSSPLDGPSEPVRLARGLLIQALEEKLDAILDRIFRLLGLRYQPRDMYNAYLGIVSHRQEIRANAVEFLDNVLGADLKRIIIPIVENSSLDYLIDISRRDFAIDPPEAHECLERLLDMPDDWLRACAIFLIAAEQDTHFLDRITELAGRGAPIVRETAAYALARLSA